jgi:hypothetical protein
MSKKVFNFFSASLGTPMCMEQLGWSQGETVLKFGVLMAACGLMCILLYLLAGPLCRR